MKRLICGRWFFLYSCILFFGLSSTVSANGVHKRAAHGGQGHHSGGHHSGTEFTIEADYFNIGTSKSNIGNAQVDTSGVRIETEYEINYTTFTLGLERWNYNWKNPGQLPFTSGVAVDPWTTFNTLQLGLEYEQEINEKWEIYYYVEAESSFEEETSNSNEYEVGIDFNFEQSKSWTYTLNINWEYLDAEGAEFGVDVEVEWNDHATEGWSGVFEISSEFPESSLTYHFTPTISATVFYEEGGTNTIRLANNSPVAGMQRGYMEDEYIGIGMRFSYSLGHDSFLAFSVQQNSEREMSFVDSTGNLNRTYQFGDSYEIGLRFAYQFAN